jgi:hypothetical protein
MFVESEKNGNAAANCGSMHRSCLRKSPRSDSLVYLSLNLTGYRGSVDCYNEIQVTAFLSIVSGCVMRNL